MKRLFDIIMAAVMIIMAASCVEEFGEPVQHGGSLSFTASYSDDSQTKTTLNGGTDVYWLPGDEIAVSGATKPFVSSADEPSANTVFTGTASQASYYYAVYPYSLVKSWSGSTATMEIPQIQKACKGSFADDLNVSVSMTSEKDMSFRFHNILGYVKFAVSETSGRLVKVTITSGAGEPLSGTVEVDCAKDTPVAVAGNPASSSVSLVADEYFEQGDYYVALLPGTYSEGLTFVFEDAEGNIAKKEYDGKLALASGQIRRIGDAPKPEEPVFVIEQNSYEVGPQESEITVRITTNIDYSVTSMPDWIEEKSVTLTSDGAEHRFFIEENPDQESRKGTIVFCREDMMCVPVTVMQKAADSQQDEWVSKEFFHRSLIMKFTGTWCGYCPSMDTAFEDVISLRPDGQEFAYMHAGDEYECTDAVDFVTRFGIAGFPSAIVDSRAEVPNYTPSSYTSSLLKSTIEETEKNYPVSTGISFTSSLSGSSLAVDVKVYAKEADDYKVNVMLLEDDVIGFQNGGGNSYEHDHVVRHVLTGSAGETAEVLTANSVWSKTFTCTVPSECNNSNLRVLVYVEKPFGSIGNIQGVTNVDYGDYGDVYVDNCRSEKVGVEAVLQFADDPGLGQVYESVDYSSDGTVVTLQTATEGNGINLVLMGDAYTDKHIADGTYGSVMKRAYEKFFVEEPYKSFRHLFNVYYVNVVSKHGSYGGETAFEGYFGAGTEVGGNDETAFDYASKVISDSDLDDAMIVVMMNRNAYAGTCYMYSHGDGDYGRGPSVSYFPVSDDDILLEQLINHETGGHGFARLDDEYSYEEYGEIPSDEIEDHRMMAAYGWWKNVDFTTVETDVKWAKFLADERYAYDGLGIYEGASTYWEGAYRPTENSIMRHNTDGFNAPSREAIYYKIHKLAYGSSWEYDYEKFVEYDAVNRATSSSAVQKRRANYVERTFEPTAPPVVIKGSWRDAGKREVKTKIMQGKL